MLSLVYGIITRHYYVARNLGKYVLICKVINEQEMELLEGKSS